MYDEVLGGKNTSYRNICYLTEREDAANRDPKDGVSKNFGFCFHY